MTKWDYENKGKITLAEHFCASFPSLQAASLYNFIKLWKYFWIVCIYGKILW